MTDQTPIGRAALAIEEAESQGRVVPTFELAQISYETIDVLEMADRASKALREVGLPESFGLHIAVTIKNWLTGKDQQ